jgi:CCL2 lectin-like
MTEHAQLRNVYFIINRVLDPKGVKLATKYNGDNKKLTLEPFSEFDATQWVSILYTYAIGAVYLTSVSFHCSGS